MPKPIYRESHRNRFKQTLNFDLKIEYVKMENFAKKSRSFSRENDICKDKD